MLRMLRESLTVLVVLTVLTGIAYPLVVSGIARVFFPAQADGSLIRRGERVVGSELIGQPFAGPGYFWSRLSATAGQPYNGAVSSGSNLGPLNPALESAVAERVAALRAAQGADPAQPIPVDLVTASGSGLDPHISPAAAFYQVGRVATARGVASEEIRALVERRVERRQLGILGEPRVNVLVLNLDLNDRYGPPAIGGSSEKGMPSQ